MGEELVEEEERLIGENEDKAAEYVTRFLMMAVENREWAVTELEKKVAAAGVGGGGGDDDGNGLPGMLSLVFPLKFPTNYKKLFRYVGKIVHFQKREYLSPYGDAMDSWLDRWSLINERGRRHHVFLTEAYDGSELVDKSPLVLWREKVQSLIGYRGKKKKIETFDELSDLEEKDLLDVDSDDESSSEKLDDSQNLVGELGSDDEEMDLAELDDEYNEWNSLKLFRSFRVIEMNEIFFVNDMKMRFCWVARIIEVSDLHNNANSARNVMVRSTRERISLDLIFFITETGTRELMRHQAGCHLDQRIVYILLEGRAASSES
ncbi:hypothetical protein AKJ16_DCAP08624 [Drosera capensis]